MTRRNGCHPTVDYLVFEREELLPRLHDAGHPDAPQNLSGRQGVLSPVSERQRQHAKVNLREAIVERLIAYCEDEGQDVETSADEILSIIGQYSGSISIAARFGAALTRNPQTLSDLTVIAIEACGQCVQGMDRRTYLRWRKKALRLLDAISYRGGLPVYEQTLKNGQICFGLNVGDGS